MKTSTATATDLLAPHHAQMLLEESSISGKVLVERGYRTVSEPRDLTAHGFAANQLLTPALEVPLFSLGREIVNYQIRPDYPRLNEKGKPIKYETPAGSKLVLDCHPFNAEKLMDPREELWITEGCKKGDSGASRNLVVISLQGVWGWMRDKAPHPDWSHIPLANRTVYLCFDADIVVKKSVHKALHSLCGFLWDRRATVYVISLEELEEVNSE